MIWKLAPSLWEILDHPLGFIDVFISMISWVPDIFQALQKKTKKTRMHSSRMLTAGSSPYRWSPCQRPPRQRPPWTETQSGTVKTNILPPPGQARPGRNMGPGSQTGSDIIQRPPPSTERALGLNLFNRNRTKWHLICIQQVPGRSKSYMRKTSRKKRCILGII